jgi:hypothetical protein
MLLCPSITFKAFVVSLSARYTGVDVELSLQLSTLLFFCHRPTVAALMVLGTDLGAITTLLAGPAAAQVCAVTAEVPSLRCELQAAFYFSAIDW